MTAVLRRVPQYLAVLFGILVCNFILLHAAPGDVVDVLAGETGAADSAVVDAMRQRLGLDQPLPIQFLFYLGHIVRLDFGTSPRFNLPVLQLILDRMPATLLLLGSSMIVSVAFGVLFGTIAARHADRAADDIISIVALLFYATPVFCLGLAMIVLFAIRLRWLPTGGMVSSEGGGGLRDVVTHLVMPALTLALFHMAVYVRLVRASILQVQAMDFVRTAHAKGLSERRVRLHHVLRNALLPLVTMVGMQVASLLGGAVLVETVFGWPGLGRLTFEAVSQRDVNLLLGLLFLSSILVVVINLLVDMLYAALDPRIAFG
jgi:peptide/nickel transport system permease protein